MNLWPGPDAPQALLDASEGAHGAAALLALAALARGVAARRAAAPRGEGGGEGGAGAGAALVPPEDPAAPFRRLAPLLQARGEQRLGRRTRGLSLCRALAAPACTHASLCAVKHALPRSNQICGGSVLAIGRQQAIHLVPAAGPCPLSFSEPTERLFLQAAQNDPRCASAAAGALAALLPLLPGAGRPGGGGGGGTLPLPCASAAAPAPPAELLAEARLSGVRRLLVSGAPCDARVSCAPACSAAAMPASMP